MPSLAQGTVVLCDRFTYSTVAFQGYGRGFDRKRLDELNALVTGGLRPDLVILLDLPVEEALRRASARNQAPTSERDTFEEEDLAFHRRVREGFLDMAASLPEQFLILDAREKPETLLHQALEVVARLLTQYRVK
jgi:dTMP kinase